MPRSADRAQANGASSVRRNPPELDTEVIKVPRLRDIKPPYKNRETIQRRGATDVVLLTVNEVEFLNCYAYLENVFCSNFTDRGKVYFGEMQSKDGEKVIPAVKVSLIRCGKGAADAQGSLTAVFNAVEALEPKAVICAGYCGGLNASKAKLGDVVISRKLATYANVRVTAGGEQQCGCTNNVSRLMGALIRSAADGWSPPLKNPEDLEVIVRGDKVMLSGPQFVDDEKRRNELLKQFPEAIAIEMEGEGVYAAAYNLQIEWVVIKGISNYADGSNDSTSDWRPFASAMAASVIHNILKHPQVLKDWPNYKKLDKA